MVSSDKEKTEQVKEEKSMPKSNVFNIRPIENGRLRRIIYECLLLQNDYFYNQLIYTYLTDIDDPSNWTEDDRKELDENPRRFLTPHLAAWYDFDNCESADAA